MTDTAPPVPLLTTEQVAELLQVTPATVRAIVESGQLGAVRVGRQLRYSRATLDAYLEQAAR